MFRVVRHSEMDRPTNNTLRYLTKVAPHRIVKDPWLVDDFIRKSLEELMGTNSVDEFGQYTRSFYTLEGHYSNLWKYDINIVARPIDPVIQQAIEATAIAFRLPTKARAISWWDLKSVPFIPKSSAGWLTILVRKEIPATIRRLSPARCLRCYGGWKLLMDRLTVLSGTDRTSHGHEPKWAHLKALRFVTSGEKRLKTLSSKALQPPH